MAELIKLVANFFAVVVIGAIVVFVLFMQRVKIDNNQMAPTLVYGDEVLIWKGARIGRTDIMVCEHPFRPSERVIGRVIAFEGETVWTDHNGVLSVGQDRPPTQFQRAVAFYDVTLRKQSVMMLGQIDFSLRSDHLFFLEQGHKLQITPPHPVRTGVYLLGDNRSYAGFDSRTFGDVAGDRCIGQVVLRWKPAPATGDDLGHARFDFID